MDIGHVFEDLSKVLKYANKWPAVAWRLGPHDPGDPCNEIRVEEVNGVDGGPRYAVRRMGRCLNKKGKWELEPIPSSRSREFLDRCRFDSVIDAFEAVEKMEASATDGEGESTAGTAVAPEGAEPSLSPRTATSLPPGAGEKGAGERGDQS